MREIKFRAWDKTTNKYIYFDLGSIYGYEGEVCGVVLPDSHTMLNEESGYKRNEKGSLNKNLAIDQYTGLKDKNGVEIYEGDVVTHGNRNCEINFSQESGAWQIGKLRGKGPRLTIHQGDNVEVIGNIYENKSVDTK